MYDPIPSQGQWLRQVTGFFAYHAVPTNFDALAAFRCHIMVLWMRGGCPGMDIPTAIVGTITAYRTHRSRDRLAVGCSCQPQPPRSSPADNGNLTPALASLFQGAPDRGMAHHYSGFSELDPDGIQTERFAHLEARTLTNAPPKVL
jgi:hypothetical protein